MQEGRAKFVRDAMGYVELPPKIPTAIIDKDDLQAAVAESMA